MGEEDESRGMSDGGRGISLSTGPGGEGTDGAYLNGVAEAATSGAE